MGKIIKYWYGVTTAVEECRDEIADPPAKLKNGFWPTTNQEALIN